MTDTTMQLLSQGTDPVKMPDFDILAEGKTLSGVAERGGAAGKIRRGF